MCCFQDAVSNILPLDWFDPYGRTPFAKNAELSVDITIVETDDGIKASSVKNPPTSGSSRLMNAVKNALGVGCLENEADISSPQAADLGKQNDKKKDEKKDDKHGGFSEVASKQGLHKEESGGSGQDSDGQRDSEDDETSDKKPNGFLRKQ